MLCYRVNPACAPHGPNQLGIAIFFVTVFNGLHEIIHCVEMSSLASFIAVIPFSLNSHPHFVK